MEAVVNVKSGIGSSCKIDAREAGREAATAAVAGLDGEAAALALVFTTPRYDLPALLAGIREITGAAHLVGATGSGEILRGHYMGFGEGVGVMVLSAGRYRFGVASEANICGRLDAVGQSITRAAREQAGRGRYGAVILLADCLAGNLQELFSGAYRITGPRVPIVGGAAGDEMKFVRTFVFHDGDVVDRGAVALWISGDEPFDVVTRHGWDPIGVPLLVTRANGVDIMELDGRPAALVYEEQLGIAPGALAAADFWGTSVKHPLGLMQSDGTFIIRAARAKSPDGTLRIQGCVPPEGSAVQVMASTTDKLLGISSEVGAIAGASPDRGALLTFSCAARAMLLGPRIGEEPDLIQKAAGDVPAFGIYCCGEFARTVGTLGTHNCTLTAIAL
jgi:hypothetical protein